uniref:ORF1/1 n=1 Tax=Torque teno sus virus 1a TaxID=687386 RepID=E2IVQ0_9VIRU|nr:ORF1/1 [Torque teno sus virus 1a]AXV43489.1 ORF1/1 [Torque teno sus virus 1a]
MRFRRRRFGRRRRYYRKRRGGWRRRFRIRRRRPWRRWRFGGMYQPPTGIQDPCTSNPTYPVRMVGAVTHPKYAGQGGITTQIGDQGITAASIRAISAAPPATYTQSAFLKAPEAEKEEERESETSFTSAESSSEGDGSSDEQAERRAARKRVIKLLLRRLADRPVDNKRRRFSE